MYQKKKLNESLNFFNKCLNINPNFYQALINKGTCLQEMGKFLKLKIVIKKA